MNYKKINGANQCSLKKRIEDKYVNEGKELKYFVSYFIER